MKKLTLTSETLKQLVSDDLPHVEGGMINPTRTACVGDGGCGGRTGNCASRLLIGCTR